MDEKVKKKKSMIDKSDLGSNFELWPNEGKKKKHKERKKSADDKILESNETLKENCTGEAADKQRCSVERNITFMGNKEEESHINKRKKKKRGEDIEMIDTNIADDKEVQSLDKNQESRLKKRKNYDDSLNGMQEMGFSQPSKKGKVTVDNELKNNEGGLPLERISTGNGNAHSLTKEVDCQGKKMEKKKLSNKSKKTASDYKINDGDHSVVIEEGQGKKMKMGKILSKKNKRIEDEECETNGGDPCLPKSNVVDPAFVKSNYDQHLVKSNECEDDDQGKKMKKKKKKKSREESKHKDYHEFKSNDGGDDDQGKKMKKKKKKKLIEESKLKEYNEFRSNEGEDGDQGKMMKKKKLSHKRKSKENSEFNSNEGDSPLARVESRDANGQDKKIKEKKKAKAVTVESPNPAALDGTSKPKRVTFSDQVEVCCDGLVRGKRYTPEEDEKIKAAVFDYIESHGLGDEGVDMILHCKQHREIRGCWKEISAVLPERPPFSVYQRAHILFERSEDHKWTPEELEFIRNCKMQHGSDWKSIAEAMGRCRYHVKDAWRGIKLANVKRGHWSQEELQTLFDLVNLDLRTRAKEGYRKSQHGMLRDNISWEAIGEKLATRTSQWCCKKWYMQLTSPLVASGEWCDTDDYRLIDALYTLDACCMEEVDWDNLLEYRSGDVCRKRWNQMVPHIGEHAGKSFSEQVELLAKRFCPDLVEAREAFDNKPVCC